MPLEAAFAHLFACLIQTNPQRFFGRIVYPPKEGCARTREDYSINFAKIVNEKMLYSPPLGGEKEGVIKTAKT